MDLLYFLTRRLQFIHNLYHSAVQPFEEKKQQIHDGEPPYVDNRNSENYVGDGEPRFLAEWEEADDCAMVIGHWCLCMVQATLFTYLESCISRSGSLWWDSSRLKPGEKKGKSQFERYRLLFLEDLGVDWQQGPVSLADLEQLNLTRDDLVHPEDIMTFNVERDEKHAERFPNGHFIDELWRGLSIERIRIDADKLALALRWVTDFCGWLDGIRCQYPRYIQALTEGTPWPNTTAKITLPDGRTE